MPLSTEEKRAQLIAAQGHLSTEEKRAQLIAAQQGQPIDSTMPVAQQEHPEISFGERFAVKNFGGDPTTAVKYLKSKHPNMLFTHVGDQLVMRKPDERQWSVLDPQGFDPADITDLGYDIASGVGAGAATTAAGLAAGAATGGVGAIPAAMAAGGASSAGLEGLRQYIGQKIGVAPENFDKKDILISGVLGGISPALLGTGATAGKIAAKALASGVDQTALAQTQRGVTKFMPEIAQMLGGTSAQTIRSAGEKSGGKTLLQLAEHMSANGVTPVVEQAVNDVSSKLGVVKKGLQQDFSNALKETNTTVDLKDVFQKHLHDFGALIERNQTQLPDELMGEAKNLYRDFSPLFTQTVESADGAVSHVPITEASGEVAMAIKQRLKDLTDHFADTEGKSASKTQIMRTAQAIYSDLNTELSSAINKADTALGGKGDLVKKYATHMAIERDLAPLFKSKSGAFNALRTMDNKSKRLFNETIHNVDKEYGTDLGKNAKLIDVWSNFGKPSFDAVSSGGSTSSSRSGAAAVLGGGLGSALGSLLGFGAPGAAIGGAAGAFAGAKVASPASIKQVLKLQQATGASKEAIQTMLNKIADKAGGAGSVAKATVQGIGAQPAPFVWNTMKGKE